MNSAETKEFLAGFITLNRKQQKAVIHNLSKKQCLIFRTAARNILLNQTFDLTDKEQAYLARNKHSLLLIANKLTCDKVKKSAITNNHLLTKRIAEIALAFILEADSESVRGENTEQKT